MKAILNTVRFAVVLLVAVSGAGDPDHHRALAEEKLAVRLATATPGGGFEVFGRHAAEVLNAADPDLAVVAENTKGSLENIALLADGRFDLGLVQGVAAHEAFAGIGQEPVDLKVIAAIYSSPGMFSVSGSSAAQDVRDLVGKRIAWGTPTSGLTIMAKYAMDGLGFERDSDFEPVFLEKAGEGPPLLLGGEVAAFWGAGIGWPGFTKVTQAGGRLFGFSAQDVATITAKHPFLRPMTVAAGSYPGQERAIETVGVWSFILARPGLADETAYRIAKALHQGQPALEKRLAQASETTPRNTAGSVAADRIHPGVQRYLRELGLLQE